MDVYVLGNIDYLGDLEAGREAYVFRYADQPTVSFSCEIRLDLKKDGKCVVSSYGVGDHQASFISLTLNIL